MSSDPADVLAVYRRERLTATLIAAQQDSPFYGELLSTVEITPETAVRTLSALPVLNSSEWEDRRGSIRTRSPDKVIVGFTSGYTGTPKMYMSTEAERQAYLTAAAPLDERGRTLNFVGINHGVQTAQDNLDGVVTMPLVDPGHYAQAARLLERDAEPYRSLPPFDAIAGTLRNIKHLSLYLLNNRTTLTDLGIKKILVYRHLLSAGWRRRLQDWWGADVSTSYGISELTACGFESCAACDHYHAPPSAFTEYLDPIDRSSPVRPGERGTLVITALHPFVDSSLASGISR